MGEQSRTRRSGDGGLPHRAGRPIRSKMVTLQQYYIACLSLILLYKKVISQDTIHKCGGDSSSFVKHIFQQTILCENRQLIFTTPICVSQAAYLVLGAGSVVSADQWVFPSADAMEEECEGSHVWIQYPGDDHIEAVVGPAVAGKPKKNWLWGQLEEEESTWTDQVELQAGGVAVAGDIVGKWHFMETGAEKIELEEGGWCGIIDAYLQLNPE